MSFLVQNSFPMREWHVKHMEKTIIKFVTGISADANRWDRINAMVDLQMSANK
jgi:hypothetical protein